jgi:hypothetical protein
MKALTVSTQHVPGRERVRVRLQGMRHSLESFEILIFLNLPPEEVETAGPDHPRYVGSLAMYGFGYPQSADEAVPPSAPFEMVTDLFPPPEADAARVSGNQLTLVLVTPEGERLDPSLLRFDALSVESDP